MKNGTCRVNGCGRPAERKKGNNGKIYFRPRCRPCRRVGLQAGAHVPQGTLERMVGSPIINEQGDFTGLANDGQPLSENEKKEANFSV
jgi:hypothetical protein